MMSSRNLAPIETFEAASPHLGVYSPQVVLVVPNGIHNMAKRLRTYPWQALSKAIGIGEASQPSRGVRLDLRQQLQ